MARLSGLPFCDALELERRRQARNARNISNRAKAGKTPIARIRARWGMDWHELLTLLHAEGLTRSQCAEVMGYKDVTGLNLILWRNPQHDPWEPSRTIPAQYFIDTGETFPAAVRRMKAEGKTKTQTMVAIGYGRKSNVGFNSALKLYGIADDFVHACSPSRPRSARWARILELRAGAPKRVQVKQPKPKKAEGPHPWVAVIRQEIRVAEDRREAKEKH